MSRRDVPCLMPGHTAVVGWDPPLQTYFGQVRRVNEGDDADQDPVVHWVGASGPPIADVWDLEEAMRGYAQISFSTALALLLDKVRGQ